MTCSRLSRNCPTIRCGRHDLISLSFKWESFDGLNNLMTKLFWCSIIVPIGTFSFRMSLLCDIILMWYHHCMILRSSVKALCTTDILHIWRIPTISIVHMYIVILHPRVITTYSKKEKNNDQLVKSLCKQRKRCGVQRSEY
jgi:hypothetical protein